MAKEIVFTEQAPKAVGPYVQAVKEGNIVYCSGQLGIDVDAGGLAEGVEAQAHCSMKNLGAVLEASGSSYKKVLKTLIFLTDMNDFAAMNEVYATFFPENPPARSAVEVARLPKDAMVEIEAIAVR